MSSSLMIHRLDEIHSRQERLGRYERLKPLKKTVASTQHSALCYTIYPERSLISCYAIAQIK
ncbi:MAG TPA: hypothetical protein V6D35_03590 [Candidatus Sericytochromatia bacterium]